tara:strand:- start:4117 stop:4323 length:207 start_codon:yes stop_codon:yes gene_type:complete
MIRNIRHIQIKKVAYHPKLFQAILTYEENLYKQDESDEIEYIKLRELYNNPDWIEKSKNKGEKSNKKI